MVVVAGAPTSILNLGAVASDAAFGTVSLNAIANIVVTNDTVGGLSSTVVAGTAALAGTGLTTISANLAAGLGHLNIYFDSANNTSVVGTEVETWASGGIGGTGTANFVNVQSATSLANALDIAASQALVLNIGGGTATTVSAGVLLENGNTGLLDWFQYGGNTYIVEANNHSTAAGAIGALAHTGLQSGDVVVELVGLVNLNGATTAAAFGNGVSLHVA